MPKAITPKEFGPPLGMYSHGMVAPGGEILVVAGQVGMMRGEVAGADVESQTKAALENVRVVLEAGGCSMRDVIRLQTFLTSADDIPGFMRARGEVFPRHFPDGIYPPNTLAGDHAAGPARAARGDRGHGSEERARRALAGNCTPPRHEEGSTRAERRRAGGGRDMRARSRSAPGSPGRDERGGLGGPDARPPMSLAP